MARGRDVILPTGVRSGPAAFRFLSESEAAAMLKEGDAALNLTDVPMPITRTSADGPPTMSTPRRPGSR